jgi:hypothetical protein
VKTVSGIGVRGSDHLLLTGPEAVKTHQSLFASTASGEYTARQAMSHASVTGLQPSKSCAAGESKETYQPKASPQTARYPHPRHRPA